MAITKFFAIFDADGLLAHTFETDQTSMRLADFAADLPDGQTALAVSEHLTGNYMRVGDEIHERPTLPPLTNPYDLTALPPGSVVKVWNEAQDLFEITELDEPLTFQGPETYTVHILPPLPHVPLRETIEVP